METDPTTPARLWKYRRWNDFTRRMITNGEIYFSNPEELNDPYECYWKDLFPVGGSEIDRWAQAYAGRFFPSDDAEQHLRRVRMTIAWVNGLAAKSNTGFVPSNEINSIGLCSLTKIETNILMWAHYAEWHTGVCVGIRTELFSKHRILPVNYQSEVPVVSAWDYIHVNRESFVTASRTKSLDWEYENEWRLVNRPGKYFHPQCVDRVIIGLKAKPETRSEVWDVVESAGYPIEVFEARRSPLHYRVDIVSATKE